MRRLYNGGAPKFLGRMFRNRLADCSLRAGNLTQVQARAPTARSSFSTTPMASGKAGPGSATGFLYDHKHLLHETEDGVGGEVSKTYASTCDDEFGDLISETGSELYHQFDAQTA